jgi:predicted DsbA family dithiol-disulfide isomerase
MLHIDIWADFACPACYLAKPRIDQAIAASGHADAITVTYRSLELFPDAGPEPFDSFEHVLHKFGGDQTQATRLEEHMAALARAQGQPYAIHHPVASSFDAHRMLHLAAEHGAASESMDAVQRDLPPRLPVRRPAATDLHRSGDPQRRGQSRDPPAPLPPHPRDPTG